METNSNRPSAAWPIALLGILLGLLFADPAVAQDMGSVAGVVVSSWDGTPLNGATVTVRGTTLATQTDSTGHFRLNGVPPGEQVLRFSKSSYATATVTEVRVISGQTTTVNGNIRPEFYEMEEYEVTAEEFIQQTEQIIFDRQQSGAMMDAIGSEQFGKLGAGDAGAIVARVTGVSVVGGKYAVVRGLSDRYSRTLMNGVEVPSADPYRLAPQLDLFPSAMIDRIAVSKTFTPDQPGGSSGGTIDIFTKSFPEQPFFKFTLGSSYNPNSNLKDDFLADPSSSMDMLALPTGPEALDPELFGLTAAPNPPNDAPASETIGLARTRRNAANLTQSLLQSLGTADFAGAEQESPLNSSFVASAGQTEKVFGSPLGMFAGVNYKREFKAIDAAEVGRYAPGSGPTRLGFQQRGNIYTDYGASVNLGYALGEDHQLGFNFMLAHSTDEEARHDSFYYVESREETLEQWQLHYTDREIMNYQLSGKHDFPWLLGSKLEWAVGLANTVQNEPDQRFMNYYLTPGGQAIFGDAGTPFPQYPSRYFREINEDGFNYRLDWTVPLDFMPEESRFKTGYASSSSKRDFREQYFTYNRDTGFNPANPNSYLNDAAYLQYIALPLSGIRTNFAFTRFIDETYSHPYTASLDVNAVYAMTDLGIFPWLRFIGGARIENTLMELDAPRDGSAQIEQTDVLPAVSLMLTFVTNLNLRLSYSETIARPSYREIAPVQSYLPDLSITALGNTDLQMIAIKSYDARLEWFPAPGDVLSAGIFYKQLEQPIELFSRTLDDSQVTWINREEAMLIGVELEARKSLEFVDPLFKGLSLGANLTLISSSTDLTADELSTKQITDSNAEDTRPLYEQSPYLMNFDLSYEHPTCGTSLTIGANLTGPRLVLAKSQGDDIYEHTPISLDAAIGQKLSKHWSIRLGVRNILDEPYRKTYGNKFDGPIYESFKRGRTFSISLTGEF